MKMYDECLLPISEQELSKKMYNSSKNESDIYQCTRYLRQSDSLSKCILKNFNSLINKEKDNEILLSSYLAFVVKYRNSQSDFISDDEFNKCTKLASELSSKLNKYWLYQYADIRLELMDFGFTPIKNGALVLPSTKECLRRTQSIHNKIQKFRNQNKPSSHIFSLSAYFYQSLALIFFRSVHASKGSEKEILSLKERKYYELSASEAIHALYFQPCSIDSCVTLMDIYSFRTPNKNKLKDAIYEFESRIPPGTILKKPLANFVADCKKTIL